MNADELAKYYIGEAERLFGKSVSEWMFGGIEINNRHPSLIYYPETSKVRISLSKKVLTDDLQLRFQLAHEVCHTLYPAMNKDTLEMETQNVLNEGISTLFSIAAIRDFLDINVFLQIFKINSQNYYESFLAVNDLLGVENLAIIKLRNVEPYINRLTINHFELAQIDIRDELKDKLLQPFK